MSNIHAALEIGTTRTVLAIGETDNAGRIKITCHTEIPSAGVRKSQILDIRQVTQSIRSVLHALEKKQEESGSSVTLGNVILAVSGQHIKADQFVGAAQVEGSCVGSDEIEEAMRAAHAMTLPKDRELLDIIDQDYELDSLNGIRSPNGMSGRILKLNTLQIHADRNRIQDARTAADAAHLEIRDSVFALTCAADAVLQDHEKKNGVLIIDCGGGSTGFAVYLDGYAVSTSVIGIGGDHVTNDISHAFQTTTAQAEGLKTREASAIVAIEPGVSARVKVEQGENTLMDNRTISRQSLNIVVNARMTELLTIIRDTLDEQDLRNRLHAGVVLTGGGARLAGLERLIEHVLGLPVRIGRPIHVDGLESEDWPPAYATIAGALLYASRNYEDRSLFDGIFRRFFK